MQLRFLTDSSTWPGCCWLEAIQWCLQGVPQLPEMAGSPASLISLAVCFQLICCFPVCAAGGLPAAAADSTLCRDYKSVRVNTIHNKDLREGPRF